MWDEFLRAILVAAPLLYLPGYLFFRALRFSHTHAFACAPIFSIGSYAWLGVIYYELDIPCDFATILIPPFAFGCLTLLLSRSINRNGKRITARHLKDEASNSTIGYPVMQPIRLFNHSLNFDVVMLCAYLFVGIAVCIYVFVLSMPRPDAFYSRYDNMTHINAARAFLESGKWSSLHESAYLASSVNQTPTGNNTGGFYPSAWHGLVALTALTASVRVTIAANALVAFICGVCFPVGIFSFLRALLPHDRRAVQLGALVASSSAILPWVFVIKGPTWPEMLAHAFLPVVLATVMLFVEQGRVRQQLLAFVAFAVISFAALALMHPNSIFTAYVFLAAYGLHTILRVTKEADWRTSLRVIASLLYCTLIIAFWVLCYHLPPLRGVLSYYWVSGKTSLANTLANLVTMRLSVAQMQPVLTLFLLVGAIAMLRERQWWVFFTPLFFALCYVACKLNVKPLMYWCASLWYQTPYRFASKIVFFCMPFFALGLKLVLQGVISLTRRLAPKAPNALPYAAACIAFAVLVGLNYAPPANAKVRVNKGADGVTEITFSSYGYMHDQITAKHSDNIEQVYSAQELAFVNHALTYISKNELVINCPVDGSMWAYGINGMNTLYRSKHTGNHTDSSKLIRLNLNEYATNQDVQNAIQDTGASYVLLLDKDVSYEDGVWIPQTKKDAWRDWRGIMAVDDDTRGFELVLAEGEEMRLYRIDR